MGRTRTTFGPALERSAVKSLRSGTQYIVGRRAGAQGSAAHRRHTARLRRAPQFPCAARNPNPVRAICGSPAGGAAAQPRSGTFFNIKMGHRSRPYGTHCKRCFIFLTLWSCKTRLSSTRGQSGPIEGHCTLDFIDINLKNIGVLRLGRREARRGPMTVDQFIQPPALAAATRGYPRPAV